MNNRLLIFALLALTSIASIAQSRPAITYDRVTLETGPVGAKLRGAELVLDDAGLTGFFQLGGDSSGVTLEDDASGGLIITALGGTLEDFKLALNGANAWTFSSSSGATVANFSGLTLQQSGVAVASSATTITVAGTSNEIDSSAGAQSLAANRTWTLSLSSTIDLGGKTSFEIPNSAAPTVDAFGEIAGDNNLWAASRGAPVFFDGTAAVALVGALVSDTPSNGQVPTWNTGGTITWETPTSGSGDVVGPASSVNEAVPVFDGTTGKLIKESPTIMTATYNQFVKAMLMNAEVVLGGILSPAQITSDQNNYAPSGITNNSVLRLNTDASRNITGLKSMQDGALYVIHNIGSFNIVLTDEDANSTDLNRFAFTGNITLLPDQSTLLQYDATTQRWRQVGAGGSSHAASANVQIFTSTGANTWTKPANAKDVRVILVGGGGGGGSGAVEPSPTVSVGGGGGGGGAFSRQTFTAALLGSTETVTVGAGGGGGPSQTSDGTIGTAGTNGVATTFGTWLRAGGGGGGGGGGAGAGGAAGAASTGEIAGGAGSAANTAGGTGVAGVSQNSYAAAGGAAGAGVTNLDAPGNGQAGGAAGGGANGGVLPTPLAGGSAGVGAAGGNGTGATANQPQGGAGGGSGAASAASNGFAGGNGGIYGGGGGGGGGCRNGGDSGAGGNGANGIAIVITYF